MAGYQIVTPNKLAQGSIAVTNTTRYTVTASTRTLLKDIDIANNNATATTVTVYLVPSAGAAGATNILLPAVSIPANSTLQWTGNQVMLTGDFIVDIASATGCSVTYSGGECV